ncbi:hypothetical protein SRIMM317S_00682 [Streptomyces rimosus subsp. rimosus]
MFRCIRWNDGRVLSSTDSGVSRWVYAVWAAFTVRLRWVSMTVFGAPVVPLVNWRLATASGSRPANGAVAGAASISSSSVGTSAVAS